MDYFDKDMYITIQNSFIKSFFLVNMNYEILVFYEFLDFIIVFGSIQFYAFYIIELSKK